jgi:hypothetical protein
LDLCERSLIEHSPLEHIAIQVSSNDLNFLKTRANFLLMNDRYIIFIPEIMLSTFEVPELLRYSNLFAKLAVNRLIGADPA